MADNYVVAHQVFTLRMIAATAITDGGTEWLTATALDQFANAMTMQPELTWSVAGALGGSITATGFNSVLYSAPVSGYGSDTIQATDGSMSGCATVASTATNGPLNANYYVVTYDQNTYANAGHQLTGNLSTAQDPYQDPLVTGADAGSQVSYQLVSGTAHGNFTLNPDGSFTYVPANNYHGADTCYYRASEQPAGGGNITYSNIAQITFNDYPAVSDGSLPLALNVANFYPYAMPGGVITWQLADLARNATSLDITSQPSVGNVTFDQETGQYELSVPAGCTSDITFSYRAVLGGIESDNTGAYTSRYMPFPSEEPYLGSWGGFTKVVDRVQSSSTALSDNDTGFYAEAGATLTMVVSPAHGTAALSSDGATFTYSAMDAGYTGWDYFECEQYYQVRVPGSNALFAYDTYATIGIWAGSAVVNPYDRVIQAQSGTATSSSGDPDHNNGLLQSLNWRQDVWYPLGNLQTDGTQTDQGGGKLQVTVAPGLGPQHGTVTIDANTGAYTYTPAAGFSGRDCFSFQINDGSQNSPLGTVWIDVAGAVNSTKDGGAANPAVSAATANWVWNNGARQPEVTLRSAIQYADAQSSNQTYNIGFAIPTSDPGYDNSTGVWTINTFNLNPLTTSIMIDGVNNPGGTNPPVPGGPLHVVVDGSGFDVMADNSSIADMVIIDAPAAGVMLAGNSDSVSFDYIGVQVDGTTAAANAMGVMVLGSSDSVTSSVISGNTGDGVWVLGSGATGNTVTNNKIGTDATGTHPVANWNGVDISGGATGNTVSGNTISGNGYDGVFIMGSNTMSNTITNNYIGTDSTGANPAANSQNGVEIASGASGTAVSGNTISGNGEDGVLITDTNTTRNTITNNKLGTDTTGANKVANSQNGVEIAKGASNNTVGGGNTISGNGSDGVLITDTNTAGNTITTNYIGTDGTGSNKLANSADGVEIADGAIFNTVGGGNTISGNGNDGVQIWGSGTNFNTVTTNYIGTDGTGTNKLGNSQNGVEIDDGASANTVGGGNTISGNGNDGVWIWNAGTSFNKIETNYIGTDATGSNKLGNSQNGVEIADGATANTVGGGNTISGNGNDGVLIWNSGTNLNTVQSNYIGTDATGTNKLGNSQDGVEIADGASHNTVGGGNTISGNGNDGVLIWNAGTKFNTVQTNYIGTDGTGTNNLGNSQNGVEIANGASYNTVGNGNTISGNGADGVLIGNAGTNNNTVTTNYIGTDQTGTTPLPNGEDGVEIANGASFNTVGNGNIISGNALDGVRITDAGTNTNAVTTNNIRTDQTGTNPLPNGEDGVDLANGASFNTVGNGNTISGNAFDGVEISDTGTNNNTVTANNIGMDQTGSNPLPNGDDGVEIANGASFNTVGNGNTISANTLNGVHISGGTTTWNKIQGNKIGLQSGGSSALGNGQSGVLIDGNANGNLIGSNSNDPSQSNSIEYNTLDGVTIIDGTPNGTVNNAVELNSIYRNQRLGINLGDGASLLPNQANNPASGPNHLQNFPTINEVSQAAGNTLISVYLHSASAATFHIEFYGSDGSDPLWYLQGQNYLGSTNVTADANGNVQFTYTVTGTVADITATATDSNGNTSEEFGVQLTDINGSVGAQSQTAAHSDLNITNANVFAIPQSSGVIKLTAEGLAPNNADILSRVHWTVRRNQTDIATGALPSIAPDPSDPTNPRKDQVSMNGVGSFNVICYLDANGNGQYDPGEEIKVFNLAEVGVTIIQNQSQATPNSTYFAAAPTRHGRDMKISSGNFSASFAMHYKDTVMLLGGGNNGMIGVSKIHLGWLQNGVSDTFKVTYADGNTESETLTAPATFPILDSTYPAAAGHPNAILTLPPGADPNLPNEEDASRDSVVGPDPGGAGQDRTVDSCDSPAVVFPNAFPGTGSAPISTAGTNSFKVYLVAYSDDYNSWYGAYQEVDWSALFSYTNPGGGAWMNNGSTVTVTQNTVFANPTDVQALNVTISGPRFWKSATMVSP